MMLSSRTFGRLTRTVPDATRSHGQPERFDRFEPGWLAPLNAVVALVSLGLNDPNHDPNRRLVRFSQPHRREEGRIT